MRSWYASNPTPVDNGTELSVSKQEQTNPIDMLAELVRFDSSDAKSNLALIDYVAEYLAQYSIDCSIAPDPVENQANLLATIGGNGTDQGLLLLGHSDVVSATEPGWHGDPFLLNEDGSRLIGRGVCDMKGFLATVLSLAPEIKAKNYSAPVHIGITFNGESDLLGAKRLVNQLNNENIKPRAALLGKPTRMQLVTRHKGLTRIVTEVHTPGGHAALRQEKVNALWLASHLIEYLEKLDQQARHMNDPDFGIEANSTTINVGSIYGGSTSNTVAGRCTFEWEVRDVSTFAAGEVMTQFTRYCEATTRELAEIEADIRIESVQEYSASPFSEPDNSYAASLVQQVIDSDATTASANHTEATVYHQNDLPVVICGPGNINDSHRANESIEISEMARCEGFIRELIQRLESAPADSHGDIAA